MSQFDTSTLTDLTDRPITGGTILSADHEAWRNDCETRIINLNDAVQALASNQSGSAAPSANLRGQLFANTATAGIVNLFIDPDGNGADDRIPTGLTGYTVDYSTAGTATFRQGGIISVNTTQVSTATTGVLMTYTLPGGTLARDGQFVEVDAWGTGATAASAFSLQPRFGTTAITTHTTVSTGITDWHMHFVIIRTGAATQDAGSYLILNTDADGSTTLCDFASPTKTLSGDLAIDINLSANAGGRTVTQEIMIVKFGNK